MGQPFHANLLNLLLAHSPLPLHCACYPCACFNMHDTRVYPEGQRNYPKVISPAGSVKFAGRACPHHETTIPRLGLFPPGLRRLEAPWQQEPRWGGATVTEFSCA